MVSTRGVKFKFTEGEKVLCYEPDPAKTKVLYNSKVISITVGKDESGKRLVELLIHFQGWNSTWDRFVTEEYVLKDTEENRKLQRELAKKAQLTAGGNLYKRERKKRRRKLSERISESLEAKRASPSEPEPAPNLEELESSGAEDDVIPIPISDTIRRLLENDHKLVNQEHKLSKLPCTPNVITILEYFFKHWAMKRLNQFSEKNQNANNEEKAKNVESIYRCLNLCKEVADGIRIYFDFTLGTLLLYRHEKAQFKQVSSQPASYYFPDYSLSNTVKNEATDSDCEDKLSPIEDADNRRKKSLRSSSKPSTSLEHTNGKPPRSSVGVLSTLKNEATDSDLEEKCNSNGEEGGGGKKSLRSSSRAHSGQEVANGKPQSSNISALSNCSGASTSVMARRRQSPQYNTLYSQIQEWRVVPPSVYMTLPPPPSLIYGATHLARLFVKLPEILQAANIPEEKLEVVLEYFGYFLRYFEEHTEWFGDEHYKENPDPITEADH